MSREEGRQDRRRDLAQVAITFNKRTFRFQCAEADAGRLELLANYLKGKLDTLMLEHGTVGDERLVLMAALTITDELFDARADIDELLDGETDKLKDVLKREGQRASGDAADAKAKSAG